MKVGLLSTRGTGVCQKRGCSMIFTIWRQWLTRLAVKVQRRDRQASRRRSSVWLEQLETRDLLASWNGFNNNPQHTGISTVSAQPMDSIHWQTSIDLHPSDYYGSPSAEPIITPANTVIVAVQTSPSGPPTFKLEGINGATGTVRWTVTTNYQAP